MGVNIEQFRVFESFFEAISFQYNALHEKPERDCLGFFFMLVDNFRLYKIRNNLNKLMKQSIAY